MKTFIRWPGNKSKYIKYLQKHIPKQFNTYVEPFLGSGSMFLYLQPKRYIVNDVNKDLMNVWKAVKNRPKSLVNVMLGFVIETNAMDKTHLVTFCRNTTDRLNRMKYSIQKAGLYTILKQYVFMSNLIVNGRFYFNGLNPNFYKHPVKVTNEYVDNIMQVNKFLNTNQGCLYNEDYKTILDKAQRGDFVFIDPPYKEPHNYNFQYNINESIDYKFLTELYGQVKSLDARGVKWLMTQADTEEIRTLFSEYKIHKFQVYRMTAKDKYKTELIIKNY